MHDHRKYHALYFILGVVIAIIIGTLMGCERADTSAGVIKEGPPPVMCCMALTPECYAQCEGIPVDEWIENTCGIDATDVEDGYWDEIKNEPIWLFQMVIID